MLRKVKSCGGSGAGFGASWVPTIGKLKKSSSSNSNLHDGHEIDDDIWCVPELEGRLTPNMLPKELPEDCPPTSPRELLNSARGRRRSCGAVDRPERPTRQPPPGTGEGVHFPVAPEGHQINRRRPTLDSICEMPEEPAPPVALREQHAPVTVGRTRQSAGRLTSEAFMDAFGAAVPSSGDPLQQRQPRVPGSQTINLELRSVVPKGLQAALMMSQPLSDHWSDKGEDWAVETESIASQPLSDDWTGEGGVWAFETQSIDSDVVSDAVSFASEGVSQSESDMSVGHPVTMVVHEGVSSECLPGMPQPDAVKEEPVASEREEEEEEEFTFPDCGVYEYEGMWMGSFSELNDGHRNSFGSMKFADRQDAAIPFEDAEGRVDEEYEGGEDAVSELSTVEEEDGPIYDDGAIYFVGEGGEVCYVQEGEGSGYVYGEDGESYAQREEEEVYGELVDQEYREEAAGLDEVYLEAEDGVVFEDGKASLRNAYLLGDGEELDREYDEVLSEPIKWNGVKGGNNNMDQGWAEDNDTRGASSVDVGPVSFYLEEDEPLDDEQSLGRIVEGARDRNRDSFDTADSALAVDTAFEHPRLGTPFNRGAAGFMGNDNKEQRMWVYDTAHTFVSEKDQGLQPAWIWETSHSNFLDTVPSSQTRGSQSFSVSQGQSQGLNYASKSTSKYSSSEAWMTNTFPSTESWDVLDSCVGSQAAFDPERVPVRGGCFDTTSVISSFIRRLTGKFHRRSSMPKVPASVAGAPSEDDRNRRQTNRYMKRQASMLKVVEERLSSATEKSWGPKNSSHGRQRGSPVDIHDSALDLSTYGADATAAECSGIGRSRSTNNKGSRRFEDARVVVDGGRRGATKCSQYGCKREFLDRDPVPRRDHVSASRA